MCNVQFILILLSGSLLSNILNIKTHNVKCQVFILAETLNVNKLCSIFKQKNFYFSLRSVYLK